MTDSDSQNQSNTESKSRSDDILTNDTFDFNTVNISETEFYTVLDEIAALNFVDEISYSLALNEVVVAISPTYSGPISISDFPNGLSIEYVGPWTDTEKNNRLCLTLSTTRLFCTQDEEAELYPGKYTNEAMAALSIELTLFPEVNTVSAVQTEDSDEVHIESTFGENLESLFLLNDVLNGLGCNIHTVWVTKNTVQKAQFSFSEQRVWSLEAYQSYQSEKVRTYQKAHLDASNAQELPCGHTEHPTIEMVSGVTTSQFSEYPTVQIGDSPCHQISVENADEVFLTISDHSNTSETTGSEDTMLAIEHGYLCTDCNVYYPFVDSAQEGRVRTDSEKEQTTSATVSIDNNEYSITYVPLAARPIGYRDEYVQNSEEDD